MMPTPCPHCGDPDPGSGKFCIHCGQPLPTASPQTNEPSYGGVDDFSDSLPYLTDEPLEGFPAVASNDAAMSTGDFPEPAPPLDSASVSAPASISTSEPSSYPSDYTGVSAASIWGPFAGKGTRGRHVAWLLDNLGEKAEDLRNAVTNRFQERRIPSAFVQPQILVAKGLLVEQRPYYLIQRGRATIGLYIAQFGKDLYISQVSYFKGPISTARIVIVALMALFALFYPVMLSGTADNVNVGLGGVSGLGNLVGMLCCLGPVYLGAWIALLIMTLYALYKFITDKDILAPLRVQPNEFDQDDLIALEKAVEQTVRESLDMVGIEQELMPPAQEYGLRQRII